MTRVDLSIEYARLLLLNWLLRLSQDARLDFTQWGRSGPEYYVGDPNALHVKASPIKEPPWLRFLSSDDSAQGRIEHLAGQAHRRVLSGDFGGSVWYSADIRSAEPEFGSPFFFSQLQQQLSDQTRIVGWRRLGGSVLLDFQEEVRESEDRSPGLFAPKALVKVHIVTPGPCRGPFTERVAHSVLEVVAAICTFALGRPADFPPTIFPSDDDAQADLNSRRLDAGILTLARKRISLDVFDELITRAGPDTHQRARAALLTYDAALRQTREQVASILFVVAAECLSNPYTSWKLARLTKRFVVFFDELMPDDLNVIVARDNFEEAFRIERGSRTAQALRRELLSRAYALRSEPVHEGLGISFRGIATGIDEGAGARRALLSEFAQMAILRFLEAPRVSLVGHPAFEPGA